MQIPAKHTRTKVIPIGLRVEEVKMPGFIHISGWSYYVLRRAGQEQKSAILLAYTLSVFMRPDIVARESRAERQAGFWLVECECLETLIERMLPIVGTALVVSGALWCR